MPGRDQASRPLSRSLRDQAITRPSANIGARLSEVAPLTVDDVDLKTEAVVFHGKDAKGRTLCWGVVAAREPSATAPLAGLIPSPLLAEEGIGRVVNRGQGAECALLLPCAHGA